MKNFMVRIWDGKNQQMIYPGECFEWTISLCGEVFKGLERQEDCEIMPFSGICDIEGNEIYEGDIVSTDCSDKFETIKGKTTIKFRDGRFFFCGGPFREHCDLCNNSSKNFRIKVIDNIYERAKRKSQRRVNDGKK